MKFGIKLPNLSPLASRESLLSVAQTAEQLGYDSVWVSDHVVFAEATRHQAPGRKFPVAFDTPAVDPLVTLAMVAGVTERIELGTSVLVLANRNPLVVAKAWASLDLLAPGRVIAGIGTGWQEGEFQALGAGDRFRRRGSVTEEFIEVLRTCWQSDLPEFKGSYYEFESVHFNPQPASPIPILLGASGERGFRRVGTVADGLHGTNLTPSAARSVIEKISEEAVNAGRDPSSLISTTLCELELRDKPASFEEHLDTHLVGTPAQIADRVHEFANAGISHIALRVRSLSSSTSPAATPNLSLSRGIEELHQFVDDVMPVLGGYGAPTR